MLIAEKDPGAPLWLKKAQIAACSRTASSNMSTDKQARY